MALCICMFFLIILHRTRRHMDTIGEKVVGIYTEQFFKTWCIAFMVIFLKICDCLIFCAFQ